MRIYVGLLLFLISLAWPLFADDVVLIHGITNTSQSMQAVETELAHHGYRVLNINYASTELTIEQAADDIAPYIAKFRGKNNEPLHLVTHSMGGLVARVYITKYHPQNLGRVVMLGPPNHGSRLTDILKNTTYYKRIFGPAGQQLGTHQSPELQKNLGPITYPLGIIAGNKKCWWLAAWWLLPGENDNRVTVETTRIEGMTDHIVYPLFHTTMMKDPRTIRQILAFLKTGRFQRP